RRGLPYHRVRLRLPAGPEIRHVHEPRHRRTAALSMARWSNWSGRLTARPRAIHFARSEADAAALLKQAAAAGIEVRAAGAGHSHAPLVPSDGIVLDTGALAGLIDADPLTRTVRVGAGTPIYALGAPLHRAGLALI